MAEIPVEKELVEQIRKLKTNEQRKVLTFIRKMRSSRPTGIPGSAIMKRAEELNFDPDDLEAMRQAIQDDTERIDWNEW